MSPARLTAKPAGLNREGLKRHQFSADTIKLLRQAYKIVYREKLVLKEALHRLKPLADDCEEVACFANFIVGSGRGIVR